MTTNSPNPVNGDVQALIKHIRDNLAQFESDSYKFPNTEMVYRIALAALTELPLYTTPPAQILRPVELPEFKVHSNQPCWPSVTVGLRDEEWIEALRQQGYEVKND